MSEQGANWGDRFSAYRSKPDEMFEVIGEYAAAEDVSGQIHLVTVDENPPGVSYAAKAFCETCNWCADHWHHEDEYESTDAAYDAAQADADQHAEEISDASTKQ